MAPTNAQLLKEQAAPVWVVDAEGNILAAGFSVSTGATATSSTASTAQAVGMERTGETETEVINLNGVLSAPFRIDRQAGFGIQLPALWTAAAVGFYVSASEGGPFLPLYNHGNNASPDVDTPVQIGNASKKPVANRAYPIPAEIFMWSWAQLWSQDGSGNNVPQLAARSIVIVKKS